MEALNNVESRKLSPQENMQRLERAILHSDQRIRIRRDVTARAAVALGFFVAVPLSTYLIYHIFAPYGVMHNHKSGSGTYMHGIQNVMYRLHSQTSVWRPEIDIKEQSSSLFEYSKRIEARRAAGEEVEGRQTNWL